MRTLWRSAILRVGFVDMALDRRVKHRPLPTRAGGAKDDVHRLFGVHGARGLALTLREGASVLGGWAGKEGELARAHGVFVAFVWVWGNGFLLLKSSILKDEFDFESHSI